MRIPGYVLTSLLLAAAVLGIVAALEPSCPPPSISFLGRDLLWSCVVVMEPSR